MNPQLIRKIKKSLEAIMEANAKDTQEALGEACDLGEYILDSVTLDVGEPEVSDGEVVLPILGYVILTKEE